MRGEISCEPARIRQWQGDSWLAAEDSVAHEIRFTVEHEGEKRLLWSRPQELKELALGNVLLEQGSPPLCGPAPFPDPEHIVLEEESAGEGGPMVRVRFTRPLKTRPINTVPGSARASALLEHMRGFLDAPGLWAGTGCSHRAAMMRLEPDGIQAGMALLVEDIGRHNCLDRLAGHSALSGLDPGGHVLFTTARLTASLYAKARRLGISFMVSRAAVTRMALHDAPRAGVALVGFCRPAENRLTVFSDPLGRVI